MPQEGEEEPREEVEAEPKKEEGAEQKEGCTQAGEAKRKMQDVEGGVDTEAWLEEKRRKREEKKAVKQKRAEEARARKEKREAERLAKLQADTALGEGEKKKNSRGWWNKIGVDQDGSQIELEPSAEALKPDAPHWALLVATLKSLRDTAMASEGPPPTWAYLEKVDHGGGRPVAVGPVIASHLKTKMLANSKGEFVEQALGFKNFSHFLQTAVEPLGLVVTAKDPQHRGQVWVDIPGCGDAIRRAGAAKEASEFEVKGQLGAEVVLIGGQSYSKGAQYQFVWDNIERLPKLGSWALWESMGRPQWVCAPMVEQSELPFRLLCKRYGTHLCYTPMFHARLFIEDAQYRAEQFTTCEMDRPLVVQFCANDPHIFAAAAQMVSGKCDAVDLNLGCPQGIAKRGRYGSFLMDELELVYSMVSEAHKRAQVPITAKIRVFDDDAKTLQYAKCLQDAGAQILTVHGRTRENKGRGATPADWSIIKKIKEHVSVPVIANGNIYDRHDAKRCIEETKVDGVMSAEWLRRNPALFSEGDEGSDPFRMCIEYLELCKEYPAPLGYVRAHIFKFLTDVPHGFQEHPDIREEMQHAKTEHSMRELVAKLAARRPVSAEA